jgi:hypothetical protein
VLLKHGEFGAIFEYARLAFVVPDASLIPRLLELLLEVKVFTFARCNNRLDPAVSAYDSGGYRDCQCLVRVPSGWFNSRDSDYPHVARRSSSKILAGDSMVKAVHK